MSIINDLNDEPTKLTDINEGVELMISDTQARTAEIFVFLNKQIPGNYFEVTKTILPNCKPETLRRLVTMGYLQKKTVVNIYGQKVDFYKYSGKPFPHITDYPFIPDLGADVKSYHPENKGDNKEK